MFSRERPVNGSGFLFVRITLMGFDSSQYGAEVQAILALDGNGDRPMPLASGKPVAAGVKAYVLKSMPPKDLIEIIRHVHAGKKRVPPEVAAPFLA